MDHMNDMMDTQLVEQVVLTQSSLNFLKPRAWLTVTNLSSEKLFKVSMIRVQNEIFVEFCALDIYR